MSMITQLMWSLQTTSSGLQSVPQDKHHTANQTVGEGWVGHSWGGPEGDSLFPHFLIKEGLWSDLEPISLSWQHMTCLTCCVRNWTSTLYFRHITETFFHQFLWFYSSKMEIMELLKDAFYPLYSKLSHNYQHSLFPQNGSKPDETHGNGKLDIKASTLCSEFSGPMHNEVLPASKADYDWELCSDGGQLLVCVTTANCLTAKCSAL